MQPKKMPYIYHAAIFPTTFVARGYTRATKTKGSSVIKNRGGGEFCEEILTPNLHFNGLIEAQYLKARFFHCFLII